MAKCEASEWWMTARSRQHKHSFGRAFLLIDNFLKHRDEQRINDLKVLQRWCINTVIVFLDIIHRLVFI
jgi:hypothetical protein